jgi:hypothetical protein
LLRVRGRPFLFAPKIQRIITKKHYRNACNKCMKKVKTGPWNAMQMANV